MKKFILSAFLITLLFLGNTFSQQLYSSVIAEDDSIGAAFRLGNFEIPVAVYTTDSLRATADSSVENKTLKFLIFVGDASGYATDSIDGWAFLTVKEDTTDYEVELKTNRYEPLNPPTFFSLIGATAPSSSSHLASEIWIKPYLTTAVIDPVTIKIRTALMK